MKGQNKQIGDKNKLISNMESLKHKRTRRAELEDRDEIKRKKNNAFTDKKLHNQIFSNIFY